MRAILFAEKFNAVARITSREVKIPGVSITGVT